MRLFNKDLIIERMEEEREDLEAALDNIEAYGERYECPNEHCDKKICSKPCFARSCFDWCLTHSHPSLESKDGEVEVTVQYTTKDSAGQVVSRTEVKRRRVCGHQEARDFPGDCNIVSSPFVGDIDDEGRVHTAWNQLWQFEQERCDNWR
ncbi:hypothetical protein FPRO04_09551 [Fusarium proliferatum]|nr:hypothetical protein FPRO04_09551 [Fusarium proliferatum]